MAFTYSSGVYGGGLYSAIGSPSSTEISTWSFSIDGHPFVLVKTGEQGTLIYDMSTQEWASWNLEGNIGLGFRDGETYEEFYLMGSPEDNKIYTFDLSETDDENGSFTSIVTGGLPMRSRKTQECFSVYAAGDRSDTDGRVLSLFTSDDGGRDWFFHGNVVLSGNDSEAGWRSLGLIRSPGRMFELQDTGVYASIQGLDMETR